jgi:HD-like signal output (HDOD) protein
MILQVTEHAHQFLTKPCDGPALIDVLQSADRRRATLPGAGSSAALKGIEHVPSLPITYARIMSAIQVHEPDMNELGRIVEQDLGVSARILQIANSSFFGLRTQVARPAEAVRVLGIDTVRGLALTVGLFQELHADPHVLGVLGRITDHCIAVGCLARRLALASGLPRATGDLAMQAGLMHDVGEFVIAELFPEAFLASHQAGDSSAAHGRVVKIGQIEVTQAEVGAYLLGIWGLADAVVEAVAMNGEPARIRGPELSVATLVYVARVLESLPASAALPDVRAKLGPEFVSRLGLDKHLDAWMAAIAEGS